MTPGLSVEELRSGAAALEMTGEQFRSLGYELVDRIAEHLDSIRSWPVTPA